MRHPVAQAVMGATPPPLAPEDRALTARALAWLAQREHSRMELRRKLLGLALEQDTPESADPSPANATAEPAASTRGPIAQAGAAITAPVSADQRVDAVLGWLEAHSYLSQQRFVESRLRARSERYGNLRIRQELAQHGVSLPAEAESRLRESELDRARAVWRRKYARAGLAGESGAAAAAKQARFLTSRGFSTEVIRKVLRESSRPQEREPDAADVVSPPVPRAHASRASEETHLRLVSRSGKPRPGG